MSKFQVWVRLLTKAFLNLKIAYFLRIFGLVLNSMARGFLENLQVGSNFQVGSNLCMLSLRFTFSKFFTV